MCSCPETTDTWTAVSEGVSSCVLGPCVHLAHLAPAATHPPSVPLALLVHSFTSVESPDMWPFVSGFPHVVARSGLHPC